MKHNQLEACDGLTYLVSLDDGLPQIQNLDSYVRIVKDKSLLRRVIFASQNLINRCLAGEEEPQEILASAEETLLKLGESKARVRPVHARRDHRRVPGRSERVSGSGQAHPGAEHGLQALRRDDRRAASGRT